MIAQLLLRDLPPSSQHNDELTRATCQMGHITICQSGGSSLSAGRLWSSRLAGGLPGERNLSRCGRGSCGQGKEGSSGVRCSLNHRRLAPPLGHHRRRPSIVCAGSPRRKKASGTDGTQDSVRSSAAAPRCAAWQSMLNNEPKGHTGSFVRRRVSWRTNVVQILSPFPIWHVCCSLLAAGFVKFRST